MNNPNHFTIYGQVIFFPRSALIYIYAGMLDFYHHAILCYDVRSVFFLGNGILTDNLSAFFGKTILPAEMPFRDVFPPRVTALFSLVPPMFGAFFRDYRKNLQTT